MGAKVKPAMTKNNVFFIGLNLGDKFYYITIVNQDGKMIEGSRLPTTPAFLERKFYMLPPCGVAMEIGAHSRWVIHLLKDLGKRPNRKCPLIQVLLSYWSRKSPYQSRRSDLWSLKFYRLSKSWSMDMSKLKSEAQLGRQNRNLV